MSSPLDASGGFVQIPNALARSRRLSPLAKTVWVVLRSHADGFSISLDELAEQTGVTRPTLRKCFDELERAGWLSMTVSETGRLREIMTVIGDEECKAALQKSKGDLQTGEEDCKRRLQTEPAKCKARLQTNVKEIYKLEADTLYKKTKEKTKGENTSAADAATPPPVSPAPVQTTLTANWQPATLTQADHPATVDLQKELRAFIDHNLTKGTQSADWDAAFRIWLRRAEQWAAEEEKPNLPAALYELAGCSSHPLATHAAAVLAHGTKAGCLLPAIGLEDLNRVAEHLAAAGVTVQADMRALIRVTAAAAKPGQSLASLINGVTARFTPPQHNHTRQAVNVRDKPATAPLTTRNDCPVCGAPAGTRCHGATVHLQRITAQQAAAQ